MPEANSGHNLQRELDGLGACLSQSKRPLAFLIGAGCPLSVRVPVEDDQTQTQPLIPDIAGLTLSVAKSFDGHEDSEKYEHLCSTLAIDLGREANIEDLLTRLRALADVVGSDEIRGLNSADIMRLEQQIVTNISKRVAVDLPESRTPYEDLAIWLRARDRLFAPTVFTTNYDLLMEQALERNHVPYFDGFVGSSSPFLDTRAIEDGELPERWIRLWKVHGSVNWALTADHRVVRRTPRDISEIGLIHPSHLKYDQSRRMPYLLMQDRVRDFLRTQSATLITLGCSFGDEHVNSLLLEGLRTNPSAQLFHLQYAALDEDGPAEKHALSTPNLSVLGPDAGIISSSLREWSDASDGTPVSCKLGDFAEFGRFARRLSGDAADDITSPDPV